MNGSTTHHLQSKKLPLYQFGHSHILWCFLFFFKFCFIPSISYQMTDNCFFSVLSVVWKLIFINCWYVLLLLLSCDNVMRKRTLSDICLRCSDHSKVTVVVAVWVEGTLCECEYRYMRLRERETTLPQAFFFCFVFHILYSLFMLQRRPSQHKAC